MLYIKLQAPELDGGLGWLNTDRPLRLKDLRGKIVLLDFWTFCCINCMHIIPDLKKLEAKYPDQLVVIGVHSAKFENEKDSDNIREAVLRYGIEHPVVNDANFAIWQAYGVHSWPTLVLIDPDGRLVGQVSGEGNYQMLDDTIARLSEAFDKQGKLNHSRPQWGLEKDRTQATPLSFPGKIVADASSGRLFIADSGHNRIVISDEQGHLIDVIGSGQPGTADGGYAQAQFHHPQGMAVRGNSLYIADTENHLLRHVDLNKKLVATVAGTGQQAAYRASGGVGTACALNSPWDLSWVGDKLYIAMAGPHQLWDYDLKTGQIGPYAGSGREDIIDGTLKSAALAQPSGLTSDGAQLYFVDSEVSAVRRCDLYPGGQVQTLVGEGLFVFGDKDGAGSQVRLQHALGILWHKGKLFVADSYNHKIKIIDPKAKTSLSFLGNGKPGLADGHPGQFSEPAGLAALGDVLFIADTNNNAIRRADINTGVVQSFPIKGLQAPPPMQIAEVGAKAGDKLDPDQRKIQEPLVAVRPNAEGKLVLDVKFPPGFHLNPESSLQYNIEQRGEAVKLSALQGTIRPPLLPMEIPFHSGKDGATSDIIFTVSIYYCCDDSRQCLFRRLSIAQKVTVSGRSGLKDIRWDCPI